MYFYFWPCWVCVAARVFSSCGECGLLSLAVCAFLTVVASFVAQHELEGKETLIVVAGGLSGCGSQALEHRLNNSSAWA